MSPLPVYILGGSGYGGGELLRILAAHPHVGAVRAVSRKQAGEPFWKAHPNLRGVAEGRFDAEADWSAFQGAGRAVVFSAMPHFELAQQLPALEAAWAAAGLAERVTLIDLSGDFRLDDAAAFERAYGKPHPHPQGLGRFVYGLPEWPRQRHRLAGARRIASPGCFATAIQLALLPFADVEGLGFVAVSAATGSSGSGASPGEGTHHPTRAQDFRAYKVLSHQHEAEITRLLDSEGGGGYHLGFVPHSAPMVRGIHATVQFRPEAGLDAGSVRARIETAYGGAPFVRLLGDEPPRVGAVTGSNFCDIGWSVRGGTVAVLAALDNLVKGMAGQAVQNMNLALGLPETAGLMLPGTYP